MVGEADAAIELDGDSGTTTDTDSSNSDVNDGDNTSVGEGGSESDWFGLLPEETRASLKKFEGKPVESLAKSYAILERTMHETGKANAIIKPDANAPKEKWDEYYQKLGRPQAPGDYKLSVDGELPDGVKLSAKYEEAFKQKMYDAGLTETQAQQAYKEVVGANIGLHKAQQQMVGKKAEEVMSSLRAEWGVDFDNRMARAHKALARFLPDDAKESLGKQYTDVIKAANSNPALLDLLQKVGAYIKEDDINDSPDATFDTLTSLRTKLTELTEKLTKASPMSSEYDILKMQRAEVAKKLAAAKAS